MVLKQKAGYRYQGVLAVQVIAGSGPDGSRDTRNSTV